MKKLLSYVFFILLYSNLHGQTKGQLSQPVINEFATHFTNLSNYDDGYINMILTFIHERNPNMSRAYINDLLADIANNEQSRDIIFQAYYDIARYFGNPLEEYLYLSLLKLNMKESTTLTIKKFILEKYETERLNKIMQEEQESKLKEKGINSTTLNVINNSSSNGSYSLDGRNLLSLPKPYYPGNEEGIVVVAITVNKNGTVTKAESGAKGTNTEDIALRESAKKAALQARFNANNNAPEAQIGTITYRFMLD